MGGVHLTDDQSVRLAGLVGAGRVALAEHLEVGLVLAQLAHDAVILLVLVDEDLRSAARLPTYVDALTRPFGSFTKGTYPYGWVSPPRAQRYVSRRRALLHSLFTGGYSSTGEWVPWCTRGTRRPTGRARVSLARAARRGTCAVTHVGSSARPPSHTGDADACALPSAADGRGHLRTDLSRGL